MLETTLGETNNPIKKNLKKYFIENYTMFVNPKN